MKVENQNSETDSKEDESYSYSNFHRILNFIKRHLPNSLHYILTTGRPGVQTLGNIVRYRHTDWGLLVIAAILGIIIGFFVALFHWSMEYADSFFKTLQNEAKHLIPWKILIIPLIPAIGGLGVGILKKTLFKTATIEGLDSLIHQLVYKEGRMDWRNSFKSIIYAALLIGSGGGAGREGPTIVLGSSIGSTFAQLLRLKPQQLRVLCGSGAAAAISGIFNAPLGGIVFALEAIIGGISIRAFAPLVVSSVLATATTRILVGNNPLLIAPPIKDVYLFDYIFLAIAGILSAFVAIYYLKTFNRTSKLVNRSLSGYNEVLKPAIGGFLAGLILMILPTMLETTYNPINFVIEGKGLPLIQNSILENLISSFTQNNIVILLILVATATVIFKPISNAISLASSGAGGTMAPVLKAGAMFGFLLGSILQLINPDVSPGLYALVCAAALLSGTFQLPLAGGIILFEICHNYDLILPLIFASVIASFIVQKRGIRTFNPLQKEFVEDEEQVHPVLKSKI